MNEFVEEVLLTNSTGPLILIGGTKMQNENTQTTIVSISGDSGLPIRFRKYEVTPNPKAAWWNREPLSKIVWGIERTITNTLKCPGMTEEGSLNNCSSF